MTKGDGGFVLTLISIVSPARKLVREQYPSSHGARHFVGPVFESIQSVVPGFAFSSTIRSDREERTPHPSADPTPAAAAPLRRSRRVSPSFIPIDLDLVEAPSDPPVLRDRDAHRLYAFHVFEGDRLPAVAERDRESGFEHPRERFGIVAVPLRDEERLFEG